MGVVLAEVLVDLVFGVVFMVFLASVCVCVCVDGQVVGTHGVGWCVQAIFMAFMALGGTH